MNDITRTSKKKLRELYSRPTDLHGKVPECTSDRLACVRVYDADEVDALLRAVHEPCPDAEKLLEAYDAAWIEDQQIGMAASGTVTIGVITRAKQRFNAARAAVLAAMRPSQPPAVGDADASVRELLQSHFWLKSLKANTRYVRLQDDHDGEFRGHLSVTIGEDGDAWVSLDEADARFRMPGFGGGASQYTRTALVILAEAIRRDNAEHPRRSAPTKSGEQA
jgi:hypothetical protein